MRLGQLGDAMLTPSGDVFVLVAAVSLTVNACLVLKIVITWIVTQCQVKNLGLKSLGLNQTGRSSKPVEYSLAEMVLSCMCFVGGVCAATSSGVWSYPFDAQNHDDASTASTPSTIDAVRIILTLAVGRFMFSFGHLIVVSASRQKQESIRVSRISSWCIFRGTYIFANLFCLISVVVTNTNYLIGAVILLLEADQLFEEAKRCWNNDRILTKSAERLFLFVLGLVLIGFRIALPVTMITIAANTVQSITGLTPLSLGVTCFSVVFYTMSAVFMVRRHLLSFMLRRRVTVLSNVETPLSPEVVASWYSKEHQSTRIVGYQHPKLSDAVFLKAIRRPVGGAGKTRNMHVSALTCSRLGKHPPRRLKLVVAGSDTILKFVKATLSQHRTSL